MVVLPLQYKSVLVNITAADPDYLPVATIINIPRGTIYGSTFCGSISIIDDPKLEDDEMFFVNITSLSPYLLAIAESSSRQTIIIKDDECK